MLSRKLDRKHPLPALPSRQTGGTNVPAPVFWGRIDRTLQGSIDSLHIPRPNCDWHSASQSPKGSPTQPWTAKDTLTQRSRWPETSPPRLVAPLTVRRCLGQNGPQLQTKCDAKTASGPPAGDLRQGFSTKGSASHFNQKIRHDGRTRTVLEICTSILCRPAFRATAWRTDWLHKNARGRFKICSAPEETKQLLLPAREHAAQAAERSTACPNRRPAPPEPDSAPHQMSWGGDASCPWGSIHGPWGVPHARSLSAGTERRDSRLFTTGQHEGQLTTLPATSTSRRKGRSVSIEGSLWGLADIGSSL